MLKVNCKRNGTLNPYFTQIILKFMESAITCHAISLFIAWLLANQKLAQHVIYWPRKCIWLIDTLMSSWQFSFNEHPTFSTLFIAVRCPSSWVVAAAGLSSG
jgi:hypothetical protein